MYVADHGAMVSTESQDPDGDMLSRIRAVVGADVPIICTLDLHANVSEAMVEAATVLVAYLTNPHVDMMEREEAARDHARHFRRGYRAALSLYSCPLFHLR